MRSASKLAKVPVSNDFNALGAPHWMHNAQPRRSH